MIESAGERANAGDITSAVADVSEAVRQAQILLHELLSTARAQGITWVELTSLVRRDEDYLAEAHERSDPEAMMALDREGRARSRPLG